MISRLDERDTATVAIGGGNTPSSIFSPSSWPGWSDGYTSVNTENPIAARANLFLFLFLLLFSISVPHSIAVSQASSALGLICWILRDAVMRRSHFNRTPADLPLLCFVILTVLSSFFSAEPSISIPKLKTLLLFGVIYLLACNLNRRGMRLAAALMIASSLIGVAFSFSEKIMGRGMVVVSIAPDSPLLGTPMRAGDVIWMVGRKRVYSSSQAAEIIRRAPAGRILNIETLHEGDPIEVDLKITEELRNRPNPLGIVSGESSRRFRVSGFSRQFMTYAEQMQMLAMITFGGLIAGIGQWRRRRETDYLKIFGLLFLFFSVALALTATRAVIVACLAAILIVSFSVGSRLAAVAALAMTLLLGGLGFYFIRSSRPQATVKFDDDSTSRRIAYMRAGLRLIPEHPVLGVGMDSHKRHWHEWHFPGEYVTHTHSTPIQIAMDRGLPALACYLWFMGALLVMLRRSYHRARAAEDPFDEGFSLGTMGALIGFSASSLANYNFGDSEALMMLLFLIGLSMVQLKSGTYDLQKNNLPHRG